LSNLVSIYLSFDAQNGGQHFHHRVRPDRKKWGPDRALTGYEACNLRLWVGDQQRATLIHLDLPDVSLHEQGQPTLLLS
jgi:hypothetical protein